MFLLFNLCSPLFLQCNVAEGHAAYSIHCSEIKNTLYVQGVNSFRSQLCVLVLKQLEIKPIFTHVAQLLSCIMGDVGSSGVWPALMTKSQGISVSILL